MPDRAAVIVAVTRSHRSHNSLYTEDDQGGAVSQPLHLGPAFVTSIDGAGRTIKSKV